MGATTDRWSSGKPTEVAPSSMKLDELRLVSAGGVARLAGVPSMPHQSLGELVDRPLESESEKQVCVFKALPERIVPAAGRLECRPPHHRTGRDDPCQREDRAERRLNLGVFQGPHLPPIADVARVHSRRSWEASTGVVDERDQAVHHRDLGMRLEFA